MKNRNEEDNAQQLSNSEKKNSNDVDKLHKISEEQIRNLLEVFTSADLYNKKLVISSESHPFSFEAEDAKEDYFDGYNKEEFERLKKQCKSNEIVIYEYTPYTMPEMYELVQDKMDSYQENHEKDDPEFYHDAEFFSLRLINEIIEQNMK